jgi:hypothetical protein
MNELEKSNTSYAILSSNRLDAIISVLYSKEYHVFPLKTYYKGIFEDSILVYGTKNNDLLREDTLHILNEFHQNSAIIKYIGETETKKIFKNGSENPMSIIMYNTDSENKSYLHNGVSFAFTEKTRYWKPSKKEDFKSGMVIEYLNNKNKWCERLVDNPNEEWEKLYKLLIKYDKVRIKR